MTDRSHAHRFGPSHTAGTRVADSCPGRRQDRAGDTAARGRTPGSGRRGYQVPRVAVSTGSIRNLPEGCRLRARGRGEVDEVFARSGPWRQGPRRSPSVRIDSTSTTPNASISGHPASPSCDGTSTPHRAQMRIGSNISGLPPRFQTVAASPAQAPASLPAQSVPRSRPRPTLGSGRRSTPRRAGNAHIRVDGPSPSHRGRRARSARQSHRWGTRFRP